MDAIFFHNRHHGQKALYVNTPYEVHRKMTFGQFIDNMKASTTVVPYPPRKNKISYGLLGTKAQPSTQTFDTDNTEMNCNFTRSKEHIKDKTHLLCIDLDVHLLLDVYGKLKGTVHPYIKNLPTEDTVKPFFKSLGLDLTQLNHLIYKSTSYGKEIKYDKESFTKTNMHIWLELQPAMDPQQQATFVRALFSIVNDKLPQELRGLNRQLKVRTAPAAPDMAVYSAARLLIQGDLTGRIVSSKSDGKKISKGVTERILKRKHLDIVTTDLYTKEELAEHRDAAVSYNKVNNTNISASDFAQDAKRTGRTLQTGELYADDPVYMHNKLWGSFQELRADMEKEQSEGVKGVLFTEDKDVTVNISDILDPINGNSNNCYVVLKPDGSMYVYHYSETRWFVVLNRSADVKAEITTIERYLPEERISQLHSNQCIIAPTGTGKTYHVIQKVLCLIRDKKLEKVVWTVPDYAALQSIEAEVLRIGTKDVSFKAVHAGIDKFDSFESNQFIICTMSKLHGELQGRTRIKPTFNHNRVDFSSGANEEKTVYDTSRWSFVVDEVHTLFSQGSSVESFMYYRILQRELTFDKLLVMSASITSELLPGHHDRGWLPTSSNTGDWQVDNYQLEKPRKVRVTTSFPWRTLLDKNTSSALIMAPTALKAVGVYEELQKVHKDKSILLYIGLPRNAAEMSVQEYPYTKDDGSVGYREYERPSNADLNSADFVVATALTAGTSLSRPYDYCVVDMQGIPVQLETRSVEVQKISRARHPDVKRTLVISKSRFERGDSLGLSPQALRTTTHPMSYPDYVSSKQLGLNRRRTEVLSPELNGGEEARRIAESVVKEETPVFVKEHVLTFDSKPTVKQHIEEEILARFDIFKAATVYYKAKDKFIAFNRESYEGSWGGGLTSYIDETEEETDTSLGKEHSLAVKRLLKEIKYMSKKEFETFMSTPPVDRAMDRAQQNIRKIEVPDTPTCDPDVGLLPEEFILHPERVRRFIWNPDFYQQMKQDAALAVQAKRQNSLMCKANTLYLQAILEPGVMYPLSQSKTLLYNYIKHTETKEAILRIQDNPLKFLRKLGRVNLYQAPQIVMNRVMRPEDPGLTKEPELIPPKSKRQATHFTFSLGWFSVHDERYIIAEGAVITPLLGEEISI